MTFTDKVNQVPYVSESKLSLLACQEERKKRRRRKKRKEKGKVNNKRLKFRFLSQSNLRNTT